MRMLSFKSIKSAEKNIFAAYCLSVRPRMWMATRDWKLKCALARDPNFIRKK